MTAHGAFHWNELMTRDPKKAKGFYKKALGWSFDDMPMGDMYGTYTIIKSGDQMVGGMFKMDGPMFDGQPDGWFTYVAVDDLDKRLKKAREAGGATKEVYVYRNIEDPNDITVILGWRDLDKARAFIRSVSLKGAMQSAGVTSAPDVRILETIN